MAERVIKTTFIAEGAEAYAEAVDKVTKALIRASEAKKYSTLCFSERRRLRTMTTRLPILRRSEGKSLSVAVNHPV